MGALIYRGCVAFREWSERKGYCQLVVLGKVAMEVAARIVRAGGKKHR
jgi:hypothetical protein